MHTHKQKKHMVCGASSRSPILWGTIGVMEKLQYQHIYWYLLKSCKSYSSLICCGRNAMITSVSVWSHASDEVFLTARGWMRVGELVRELLWGKVAAGHVGVPTGTLFCPQLLQPVDKTRQFNLADAIYCTSSDKTGGVCFLQLPLNLLWSISNF